VIYDDLRVLDLSGGLACAYAAKLLTDLGAEVAHWEPPGGDPLRREDPHGALYAYLRTSQRSFGGDPVPWLAGADVVLLSDPSPVGLDAAVVTSLRDRARAGAARARAAGPLVVVEISALGHGGPDDGLDLPEPVLQARSGALSGHGHPGRTPLTVGGRVGEYVAGAFAALGAATAWRRAVRTGRAELVDVSKLEAMQLTMLTVPTLMAHFPGGRGSSFRFVMIPGNEPTADGRYVGITTVTAAQWRALLHAMGRDDLSDDEELTTMLGRFMRAAEVNTLLHDWTGAHTAEEIEAACSAVRVPVALVGNGELLPQFEQLRSRDVFVQQPGAGFVRPRAPFRFHHVADRPLEPAPEVPASTASAWPSRADDHGTTATVAGDPPGDRPLTGVRVVDFTAFWSGPFATAWLAAMGADVIKVESVQRPDGIRFSAAVRPSRDAQYFEKSALFHAANLSKRGITLDLTQEAGRDLARRLIEGCDVVAENFTPRVLDDFGFSYEAVRAVRPDVVMLRLPAFGLTGPWRDRPGFAQTMEQLTGMAWVTGYDGGPPIIAGGVVDPMVGAHAALAVIAALEHRDRTGEGGLVEMAMIEVAVATTAEQVIRFSEYGELVGRRGEGGVYRCAGDDEWVALDLAADPEPRDARAHWCATLTKEDAAAQLRARGIAAWPVVPGHLTLDDPQLRARGFFEPLDHALVGRHDYPTFPMRLSAGPHTWWRGPAPTLGQHTDEVLRELGLSDADLAALRYQHVIGDTPLAPA
jgi:crotonobetainyl-CoA:carnitine CoA-transferase CaiB-like acyl-CoA transferase